MTIKAGDTLIIRDGTYTGINNRISRLTMTIPSGSEGNYITIKAQNPGNVTIEESLWLNGPNTMNYYQFEGIKWIGQVLLYGNHHVRFIRCAVEGEMGDGNTSTFGLNRTHHILAEDCFVYGKGRYKYLAYQSSEIIFRRCVARQDYANGNLDYNVYHAPIGGFALYNTSNSECQNCISIDDDQPAFYQDPPTNWYGSLGLVEAGSGNKYRGSIVLNSAIGGGWAHNHTNFVFEDCVFWHLTWGVGAKPANTTAGIIRHCTFGNFMTDAQMGLTTLQAPSRNPLAHGTAIGTHNGGLTAENNILTGAFTKALSRITTSTNNCFWDNTANGGNGFTNVNPYLVSLKYLPRTESSSDLSGKATDGGDIGATIIKRIGQSGTFYGEPGYDEVTDEDLWPWPYEDWVKTEMGNYNKGGVNPGLPRGDRGFASYVSPFGSPNTLTSYIWEYLGNKIPCEIYGTCQPEPQTCSQAGGTCQANACNTYSSCVSLTGTCATGNCCSGACAVIPAPTPTTTPNIILTKTADKTQASSGEEITYTIAYNNTGTGNATDVVITDPIPAGATYVAGSATNGGTLSGATLTWNVGSVASGASGSVSFKVKVD